MRFILAILLILPSLVWSQGAATLVADDVRVAGDNRLIATGNIEVFYDGTRLSAAQVIYDGDTDRLSITGPILIQTPDGTIFTAERAALDPTLENGMLRGARLVLNQQLQMAANQIDRVDGRYSQLYKVAVTSCQVCNTRPPLWEIRAETIIHDEAEKQLYFTNTQFVVRGVPIIWLPRMRLPDPTLTRATGFLLPELRRNDQLDTGIKLPYFIKLGDHRDLTVTPYLSRETRTLQTRYREAFFAGDIEINAAITRDTLQDDRRSYLFAQGNFDLGRDYKLKFDIEATSDDAYLLDYGYSEKDRLDSAIKILRVRDTGLTLADITYYQTLRDDEDNASLPPLVGNLAYEKRWFDGAGGVIRFGATGDTAYRYGATDGDAARDVSRFGLRASYARDVVTRNGLVANGAIGARADWYRIGDDTTYTDGLRVVPFASATLQYPLATVTASGAQHLVEPTVAFAWSDASGITPPNEDSTRAELDQGNLFALSRFAADDAVETGARAAVGITWTRVGPQGAQSSLTFGRVLRAQDVGAFNPSSGLDGQSSDWLLAGQYKAPFGFEIDGRTLFDDDASLTRAATLIGWDNDWLGLNAAYIWQAADPTESRPNAVSEWTLDSRVQVAPAWEVRLNTRYDLANDRPARAGIGVAYKNECVTVDLSASRRYTSSSTVEPSTDYKLSINLNGFSAGKSAAGPRAACAK